MYPFWTSLLVFPLFVGLSISACTWTNPKTKNTFDLSKLRNPDADYEMMNCADRGNGTSYNYYFNLCGPLVFDWCRPTDTRCNKAKGTSVCPTGSSACQAWGVPEDQYYFSFGDWSTVHYEHSMAPNGGVTMMMTAPNRAELIIEVLCDQTVKGAGDPYCWTGQPPRGVGDQLLQFIQWKSPYGCPECSKKTDCFECLTTHGCDWCIDSKSCVSKLDTTPCKDKISDFKYCPDLNACKAHQNCSDCLSHSCFWCPDRVHHHHTCVPKGINCNWDKVTDPKDCGCLDKPLTCEACTNHSAGCSWCFQTYPSYDHYEECVPQAWGDQCANEVDNPKFCPPPPNGHTTDYDSEKKRF